MQRNAKNSIAFLEGTSDDAYRIWGNTAFGITAISGPFSSSNIQSRGRNACTPRGPFWELRSVPGASRLGNRCGLVSVSFSAMRSLGPLISSSKRTRPRHSAILSGRLFLSTEWSGGLCGGRSKTTSASDVSTFHRPTDRWDRRFLPLLTDRWTRGSRVSGSGARWCKSARSPQCWREAR